MNALTFTIRTKQPLLIPSYRPGEENSAETLTYIPGAILRGMFVGHYLRAHGPSADAANSHFRQLFLSGDVRFLHAYPIDHREHRTLPTPLSWRIAKDDRDRTEHNIFDFAISWDVDLMQPTPLSLPFCSIDPDGDVTFPTSETVITYHNASQKRMVKRKGDSTVFRYEAIAPGERFAAIVIAKDVTLLEQLKQWLDAHPQHFLGKSRRAGYGAVVMEDIVITPQWGEYTPIDEPDTDKIILTLLSDTLLRHPQTGQWTSNLGVVLDKEVEDAFFTTTIVGGINSKWGLPLPQTPALRAGSVFVFPANTFSHAEIERLTQEGLGERRIEGFGRIAIQWQGQEQLRKVPLPGKRAPISEITLGEKDRVLASRMARQMLEKELNRRLLDALSSLHIKGNISNSQISRLRLAVRRAQEANSWRPMAEFLDENDLKSTARRQLERARVSNGDRLLSWLQNAVQWDDKTNSVRAWSLWDDYIARGSEPTKEVAKMKSQADDAMKLTYTLRLIDAFLHKASKKGGKA